MSRFVSSGTNDDAPTPRDEAWLQAQQELEAKAAARKAAERQGNGGSGGGGGGSLYETLQANKAAKQDAFEESIRLKNQFRSLDEDEIEFLDGVLESTRAKEEEVRRQTRMELDAFRARQEEAVRENGAVVRGEELGREGLEERGGKEWKVSSSRKRKKGSGIVGGVKIRRMSSSTSGAAAPPAGGTTSQGMKADEEEEAVKKSDARNGSFSQPAAALVEETDKSSKAEGRLESVPAAPSTTASIALPTLPTAGNRLGLGLGAYSSDEDD